MNLIDLYFVFSQKIQYFFPLFLIFYINKLRFYNGLNKNWSVYKFENKILFIYNFNKLNKKMGSDFAGAFNRPDQFIGENKEE